MHAMLLQWALLLQLLDAPVELVVINTLQPNNKVDILKNMNQ